MGYIRSVTLVEPSLRPSTALEVPYDAFLATVVGLGERIQGKWYADDITFFFFLQRWSYGVRKADVHQSARIRASSSTDVRGTSRMHYIHDLPRTAVD